MLNGKIEIYRTILQINDIIDLDKYNLKSKLITPLDEYLGIDKLPFKVSLKMMIEIAFWGHHFKKLVRLYIGYMELKYLMLL